MGRFVKQLLLLTLALVAPGFLWAANWMHVGDTLSFSRYVDLDSLSVQGARRFYVGEVRYRTVVEYRGMLYDKVRFGAERRSRDMDEKEKRLTAYHEAGHAVVMEVLEHAEPVHSHDADTSVNRDIDEQLAEAQQAADAGTGNLLEPTPGPT